MSRFSHNTFTNDSHLRRQRGSAAIVAVALCTVSFGCSGKKVDFSLIQPEIPLEQTYTVAVLPFEADALAKDDAADFGEIRRLEQSMFPARLAETIERSPWFNRAFYSPVATSAVDYTVRGRIDKSSNGERTKVFLEAYEIGGERILARSYTLDLSTRDKGRMPDPNKLFWNRPVNDFARILIERFPSPTDRLECLRLAEYADLETVPDCVNGKCKEILDKSVRAEQDKLLAPVTALAITNAETVAPGYAKWSYETTKYLEQKRAAQRKKVFAALMTAVSFIGGMVDIQGSLNVNGVLPNTAMLEQNLQKGMTMFLDANNRSGASKVAMEQLTDVFASSASETAIEFDNTMIQLSGPLEDKIAQLREITKTHLLLAMDH